MSEEWGREGEVLSFNGLGSSMNMMMTSSMRRPYKEQMFVKIDTDGSGAIDQSELTSFAENISKMTGVAP